MPARTKKCVGQTNAVTPDTVLCRIRIRVSQPFPDLLLRLRLLGMGHDLAVRFKHICPERQLFLGRILRSKVSAPPVREALQSGTLGRCKAADGVGHRGGLCLRVVDDQTVIESILPIEAAGMCPGRTVPATPSFRCGAGAMVVGSL